jgi:hypothetical protein
MPKKRLKLDHSRPERGRSACGVPCQGGAGRRRQTERSYRLDANMAFFVKAFRQVRNLAIPKVLRLADQAAPGLRL